MKDPFKELEDYWPKKSCPVPDSRFKQISEGLKGIPHPESLGKMPNGKKKN